jgi:phosphatidylglycerol:prolipoprotein diacylglycerol transferase
MLDPIAFQLGPVSVHWYGIIMATAFILGAILATHQAKKEGMDPEHIYNMLFWIIPSAILGARTYYVIFELDRYDSFYEMIAVWQGGLAIHGGLIGGTIAGILYVRKHKLGIFQMADIVAPSVILGQAIGRWGNFMNQEAHGAAVSQGFISNFPEFIQRQMFINGQYYHPTFLYESLWNLGVFVFLLFYRGKKKLDGEVALLYLSLYSVGRFFIEGMRTDSLMLGPLRVAQLMSLALIIFAIGVFMYRRWKGEKRDPAYLKKV